MSYIGKKRKLFNFTVVLSSFALGANLILHTPTLAKPTAGKSCRPATIACFHPGIDTGYYDPALKTITVKQTIVDKGTYKNCEIKLTQQELNNLCAINNIHNGTPAQAQAVVPEQACSRVTKPISWILHGWYEYNLNVCYFY